MKNGDKNICLAASTVESQHKVSKPVNTILTKEWALN
jgi:hypothetical protein